MTLGMIKIETEISQQLTLLQLVLIRFDVEGQDQYIIKSRFLFISECVSDETNITVVINARPS